MKYTHVWRWDYACLIVVYVVMATICRSGVNTIIWQRSGKKSAAFWCQPQNYDGKTRLCFGRKINTVATPDLFYFYKQPIDNVSFCSSFYFDRDEFVYNEKWELRCHLAPSCFWKIQKLVDNWGNDFLLTDLLPAPCSSLTFFFFP